MKNSILLRHMLLLSGAVLIAGCAAMQPIDVRDAKSWVWVDRAVAFASLASLSLYAADRR
jgi:hypothetical protein